MLPPTLADFNFKLDDHCFYAEEEAKVLGIARQMDVYEPLIAHDSEAVILSFFYTDRRKVLDLALFMVLPEGGPQGKYLCFYFRDFLHQAYNIGGRLHEYLPPGIIDHKEYREELLPALNFLLKEFAPKSKAALYCYHESWGFYFRKYKGWRISEQN